MVANPQLENGYTRLANELLDALLRAGLSSRQWAIVMAVVRKTYGFNKKSDEIGLSQLSAMTGIAKPHCSRTVTELVEMKILVRTDGHHAKELGLNKNHKQWGVTESVTRLPKEQPVTEVVTGGYQNGHDGVTELVISGLPNQQPQKKGFKDNQKTTPKDMCSTAVQHERFDRFYAAYPKKRNRKAALKAFEKLNPDDALVQTMIDAVNLAMTTRSDWKRDDGQFIPLPASWINAEGWLDSAGKTEYDAKELEVIELYNDLMGPEWPRAVAEPYSAPRATAIREFLGFRDIPDMARKYFEYCAGNMEPFDACGFDWIIRQETYLRAREGAHRQRKAA
jgi:phage replication O-like protein O